MARARALFSSVFMAFHLLHASSSVWPSSIQRMTHHGRFFFVSSTRLPTPAPFELPTGVSRLSSMFGGGPGGAQTLRVDHLKPIKQPALDEPQLTSLTQGGMNGGLLTAAGDRVPVLLDCRLERHEIVFAAASLRQEVEFAGV